MFYTFKPQTDSHKSREAAYTKPLLQFYHLWKVKYEFAFFTSFIWDGRGITLTEDITNL